MTERIASPHDGLVKGAFGQIEHARGELRSIVPAAIAEALDWSALAVEPGSFVDTMLSYQHTDLLYSLTWREGGDALVYVLFEHQSTPSTDGLMGERLHRYQARIWKRWRDEHPKAKKVPMILSVVMYHGAQAWPDSLAFEDLIDVPPELRPGIDPHLVRFTYVLHDLSQISEDELRAGSMRTARAKLVELLLKHGRTDVNLLQLLRRWMGVVREMTLAPNGIDALAQLMRYACEVNGSVDVDELRDLLAQEIGPEAKEAIMTTAELIEKGRQLGIEQGRQQGRQQGIEQGRQQGIEQGRQRMQVALLRQLRQRFATTVTSAIEQRIAAASFDQLEDWSVRALSAATLHDLLGD